uniref:Uncharacterized protein n=1 Tax=Romanomermis culicivorax TaxID=13658 RepID=A0A915HJ90_ROMCU
MMEIEEKIFPDYFRNTIRNPINNIQPQSAFLLSSVRGKCPNDGAMIHYLEAFYEKKTHQHSSRYSAGYTHWTHVSAIRITAAAPFCELTTTAHLSCICV